MKKVLSLNFYVKKKYKLNVTDINGLSISRCFFAFTAVIFAVSLSSPNSVIRFPSRFPAAMGYSGSPFCNIPHTLCHTDFSATFLPCIS